ncbi:MAG: hypothetical protein AB7H81_14565 [Vicinamibacterales bacterium]
MLTILAPVVMGVGLALAAARRRLVQRFLSVDATRPERAIAVPVSDLLARHWLGRLRNAGVVHAAPSGALWLDPLAWAAFRSARRLRALAIAAAALVALLLVLWRVR